MEFSKFPDLIPALDPCPLCGRSTAPYDQRASNLLDTVSLLEAVIHDLKKAAEEVAS